ncbi:MAG: rhodanese-like domain-containing protein [Saprospiraceae bacterium]|nr:rhodanese-like domain-containing protein [Saprospiraceae bacterium]
MIQFLKKMFSNTKVDYKQIVKAGAIILDVRTPAEFSGGHIPGSLNIPLQDLNKKLSKLDKNKTIISCCASGMRSAAARKLLLENGFVNVYNGGGWHSLSHKIK